MRWHERSLASGSGIAADADVFILCNVYGARIHREASNPIGTTAGAVADALRAAHQRTASWDARPRGQLAARCTFPPPNISPNLSLDSTTMCPGGIPVLTGYVNVYVDAGGHATAVPSSLLDSPCRDVSRP